MIFVASGTLEWLAVGGFLTIVGALIKLRGWTFLLAGYDESASVPDDVVQDMAGNTILRVGIVVFLFGILNAAMGVPTYLGFVIGGVILLAVLRLIHRLNTYSPSEP
jgi:hypothetical protein